MFRASHQVFFTMCTLWVLPPAGAGASQAGPIDLAKAFPEGTLIYLGRAGSDYTDTVMEGTALGKMLADEGIRRFKDHLWKAIDGFLERQTGESGDDKRAYAAAKELLATLWRRPTALGVIDGGLGEQGPYVQAALVCHLGKAEKEIVRTFETLLEATGEAEAQQVTVAGRPMKQLLVPAPGGIVYGVVEGHFVLAVGEATVERIAECLNGSAASLADSKRLAAPRKKLAGNARTRSMTVYMDVAGLLEKAQQILPAVLGGEAEGVQSAMKTLRSLGVDSLESICWESHFLKSGCYSGSYLYSPEGARGLFSTQSNKPLRAADLAVIPKFPSWAAAYNLDIASIYRGLLAGVEAIDTDLHAEVTGAIQTAEEMLGFRLDEDFLALIGDTIVVFDAPENGGVLITGITKVMECSDPKQVQKRLSRIVTVIGEAVSEDAVRLSSFDHRGHRVQFVNVVGLPMPVAPAWTAHEKWLIAGFYPQMVTATLDRLMDGDPEKDSILANPDFAAAQNAIGDLGWGFSYVDTKGAAEGLYPYVLLLGQVGAAMAQGEGLEIDISMLPSLSAVTRHLFADVKVTRSDAEGTLQASYGPLPWSVDAIWSGNLGTSAIMVSVLLPSLSKAREQSKRVVCAANLRGIGQGLYIHAVDHNGEFPKEFGALIEEGSITERQFVCPSSDAYQGSGLDDCYIYIPGQTTSSPPLNVLIYERPDNHPDREGGNVLFQDCHVAWVTPYARVEELVAETKKRLAKKKKPEL